MRTKLGHGICIRPYLKRPRGDDTTWRRCTLGHALAAVSYDGAPVDDLVTERLHLHPLTAADLDLVALLGADERVMLWFGGTLSRAQSAVWLDVRLAHWREHGYGRFLVWHDDAFVGIVGLSRFDFDAGIVPGIEIAWRLVFDQWGRGYATEAARAVLRDGADRVNLDPRSIIAVTTPSNVRSRAVMERLGMVRSPDETFEHPNVPAGSPPCTHVVYRMP